MEPSEMELYTKVLKKDSNALELLYDRYEKLLYSFALKMVRDTQVAEEVVQEVFMKLWRSHSPYSEEKGRFSSWLLTMARNTSLDILRKRKAVSSFEYMENDSPVEHQTTATEDLVEWKETGNMVREAVSTLKDEQKRIVDLFYFKGFTQHKIAEVTSIPLGTVKGRLRLALKHLRSYMEKEGGTPHDRETM